MQLRVESPSIFKRPFDGPKPNHACSSLIVIDDALSDEPDSPNSKIKSCVNLVNTATKNNNPTSSEAKNASKKEAKVSEAPNSTQKNRVSTSIGVSNRQVEPAVVNSKKNNTNITPLNKSTKEKGVSVVSVVKSVLPVTQSPKNIENSKLLKPSGQNNNSVAKEKIKNSQIQAQKTKYGGSSGAKIHDSILILDEDEVPTLKPEKKLKKDRNSPPKNGSDDLEIIEVKDNKDNIALKTTSAAIGENKLQKTVVNSKDKEGEEYEELLGSTSQKKTGSIRRNYEDKIQLLGNLSGPAGAARAGGRNILDIVRNQAEADARPQNSFVPGMFPLVPQMDQAKLAQLSMLGLMNNLYMAGLNQSLYPPYLGARAFPRTPEDLMIWQSMQNLYPPGINAQSLPLLAAFQQDKLRSQIEKDKAQTQMEIETQKPKLPSKAKKADVIEIDDDEDSDEQDVHPIAVEVNSMIIPENFGVRNAKRKIFIIKRTKPKKPKNEKIKPFLIIKSKRHQLKVLPKPKKSFSVELKKTFGSIKRSREQGSSEYQSSQNKTLSVRRIYKQNEGSPLEGNLAFEKKKENLNVQGTARYNPYNSEMSQMRTRSRNRLNILNNPQTRKANELKEQANKNKSDEQEEEEDQEEELTDEEEENTTSSGVKELLPNPKKRIKIGTKHQAVVPPLLLNQQEGNKPRRFKSVWNPDSLSENKVESFLDSVKTALNNEHCNQDFVLRILNKNQMDCEKTVNIMKCNEYFFTNLLKVKSIQHFLKRSGLQRDSEP